MQYSVSDFVTADRVIATALSPPYLASWSNPPTGNFAIVAKAYDDVGVADISRQHTSKCSPRLAFLRSC